MRKNSKENKKSKNKNNVYKIKSDKTTEKNKTKSIELNFGFIILKIIVIALLALLITTLTAKTVMTKIRAKESTSETGNEGIASIAKIDVQYTLSDDESYSTVTITSNYPVTQIEVSEEDYNEDLEEEDYIFIVEDDWEVTEEGLVLIKDFTENIDKAYRLTFEDETYIIQEIIITEIIEAQDDEQNEVSGISTEDENGNTNYDDEVSVASVSVSTSGRSSVGAATLNVNTFDSSSYTSLTVSGSLGKTTYDGIPIVYLNVSSLSARFKQNWDDYIKI